jgi:hypothetical protein
MVFITDKIRRKERKRITKELLNNIKEEYEIDNDESIIIGPIAAHISNYITASSPDTFILVGPSGSLKSIILMMISNDKDRILSIDDVTVASLVTGQGGEADGSGKDIFDKLNKTRKNLLIHDCSPILSGDRSEVIKTFSVFRALMDGRYSKAYGKVAKGGKQKVSEYLDLHSSVLTACTDVIEEYFDLISKLGQRIVFLRIKSISNQEKLKDLALKSEHTVSYREEINKKYGDIMKKYTHAMCDGMYSDLKDLKIEEFITPEIREKFVYVVEYVMRTQSGISKDYGIYSPEPIKASIARMYNSILKLMATRAYMYGRTKLNEYDINFGMKIAQDNIPRKYIRMLHFLSINPSENNASMIAGKIQLPLKIVKNILDELLVLKLVSTIYVEPDADSKRFDEDEDRCIWELNTDGLNSEQRKVIFNDLFNNYETHYRNNEKNPKLLKKEIKNLEELLNLKKHALKEIE